MQEMTFQDKQNALKALERAISLIGGVSDTARAVEVARRTIYNWRETGTIPAPKARRIEEITNGAVTAFEFRPDVFKAPPEQ